MCFGSLEPVKLTSLIFNHCLSLTMISICPGEQLLAWSWPPCHFTSSLISIWICMMHKFPGIDLCLSVSSSCLPRTQLSSFLKNNKNCLKSLSLGLDLSTLQNLLKLLNDLLLAVNSKIYCSFVSKCSLWHYWSLNFIEMSWAVCWH